MCGYLELVEFGVLFVMGLLSTSLLNLRLDRCTISNLYIYMGHRPLYKSLATAEGCLWTYPSNHQELTSTYPILMSSNDNIHGWKAHGPRSNGLLHLR